MTCPACSAYEEKPQVGRFIAGCKPCAIRELSQSLCYWQSMKAGSMTAPYRTALAGLFPGEEREGHSQVKAAYQRHAERRKQP